jgi:hypothetical protein
MRDFLLALAAAGSLAAVGPVLAQSAARSVPMAPRPGVSLAGFSGDAQALPNAISAIEAATGGRVVEIRYNNVAGVGGFDFVLARDSQLSFERVTGPNGDMTELSGQGMPSWMLDWPGRKDARLVSMAKVPLADAVRTVESTMGAPAVAAGMAQTAANANTSVKAYNVAIVKDGEERRVAVDSDNGFLIADPSMLAAW